MHPDRRHFEVSETVLWFRWAGTRPETGTDRRQPVYEAVRASPGEAFHLVADGLVHVALDGTRSFGVMAVGDHAALGLEDLDGVQGDILSAMERSGRLVAAPATAGGVTVPSARGRDFPAGHVGIARIDTSPEFQVLMTELEDVRFDLAEEGVYDVLCGDFGRNRTVTIGIVDRETDTVVIRLEHDTLTDAVKVIFSDHAGFDVSPVVETLASAGFVGSAGDTVMTGHRGQLDLRALGTSIGRCLLAPVNEVAPRAYAFA